MNLHNMVQRPIISKTDLKSVSKQTFNEVHSVVPFKISEIYLKFWNGITDFVYACRVVCMFYK